MVAMGRRKSGIQLFPTWFKKWFPNKRYALSGMTESSAAKAAASGAETARLKPCSEGAA
jgi:hypothetical protein